MRILLPFAILVLPVVASAQALGHAQQEAAITAQDQRVRALTAPVRHSHEPFVASWNSLAGYRTPAWFEDAKFGIFVHWGVYSVPAFGNEWYSRNMYIPGNPAFEHEVATYGPQSNFGYKNFIPMFRAEHFDPKAWVDLFVRAGARYVVPVAEHCDGFSMYDSPVNPWNAVLMGPHRDVVGELEKATRARGLHFGVSSHVAEHWWWYGVGRTFDSDVRQMTSTPTNGLPPTDELYGPAEPMALPETDGVENRRKEPDPSHLERWLPPNQAYVDEWLAKSTELIDKYHPDFFYFDWWIGQPAFKPALQQFAAYYYDRSAEDHRQPVLTYKEESMPANTATLDIERGKLDTLRLLPWQTDTSISVHSWGYVENDEYRTAKSLVQQLVDTVAKNGNLLLNVGPKADGTIPEQAKTVLLEVGQWLAMNGEAIYNTRPFTVFGEGPTKAPADSMKKNKDIQTYTSEDIRFTTGRSSTGEPLLYALLMGWPADGDVTIHTLFTANPYLKEPICHVDLIGGHGGLPFRQEPDGLHVTLPSTAAAAGMGDIAYVLRIHTLCR